MTAAFGLRYLFQFPSEDGQALNQLHLFGLERMVLLFSRRCAGNDKDCLVSFGKRPRILLGSTFVLLLMNLLPSSLLDRSHTKVSLHCRGAWVSSLPVKVTGRTSGNPQIVEGSQLRATFFFLRGGGEEQETGSIAETNIGNQNQLATTLKYSGLEEK